MKPVKASNAITEVNVKWWNQDPGVWNINETCESFKCYNGGECKMVKSRPRCACTPAFEGNTCSRQVKYGIHPSMEGDGFIRLPKERLNVKRFTLKLVFRPEALSGLLLFVSKHRSGFFSITLKHGLVFIRYGSEFAENKIKLPNKIRNQEWNTLIITRENGITKARLNYGDIVPLVSRSIVK
ncbi:pikachurin-like [Plakobranchus ocellatus]|uniref:Pikachurin-like n=1 Tax=Plakobranchus ocellatus TaxID=259542 RepID=A0AAV4CL14_9GAST|nr:pikachurin-like [Plakobranchus ocellatus]